MPDWRVDNKATEAGVPTVHRDGIPWHQAPIPRWLHRCRVQTTGFTSRAVDRCACGSIRIGWGPWLERNTRRRSEKRAERQRPDKPTCRSCGAEDGCGCW